MRYPESPPLTLIGQRGSGTACRSKISRTSSGMCYYAESGNDLFLTILVCSNVVGHLGQAKSDSVKQRQAVLFALVDRTLGEAIAKGVNVSLPALPSFPTGVTWLNTTVSSNSSTLDY